MIKKINIEKFGLFSDYGWDSEIGSDPTKDVFKKVNIIYGRNYSGKTTLSRIFRCVENGELHEDYADAKFMISTDDNTIIDQSNLNYNKKIRVYNTDFVRKNLSWLHDNKGEILPLALLGSGNQDVVEGIANLEKNINDIDVKLGTLNQETGSFEEDTLYFKHNNKETEVSNAGTNVSNLETDLSRKKRDKANNDIKKNPNYLNQKDSSKYNINSIEDDIIDIIDNDLDCSLSEEQVDLQKSIIKEDEKKSISPLSPFNLDFISHIGYTKDLLIKEIKISKKISESIELDLLDWLKQGCKLHKKTDVCEFCHNPISIKRRDELEAFFNKESEELEGSITQEIKHLESLEIEIQDYLSSSNLTKDSFYVALHSKFDIIKLKWDDAIKNQTMQIDLLKNSLSNRLKDLYTPIKDIDFKNIETKTIDFNSIIKELNNLIIENNDKTTTIETEKDKAREILRYNTIKTFLKDIDYNALLEAIEKAKRERDKIRIEFQQLKDIISTCLEQKRNIQKQIDELKTKIDDQSAAAEKINEHLRNFFGHDSIQLKPFEKQIDDQKMIRFVVKRGDDDAKNLSEGECSLVAFCYFMAKIENDLLDPDAKDKLIIYIDDPISSLDNSHIFFMFGLIDSMFFPLLPNTKLEFDHDNEFLAIPEYCFSINQLFISTHNLDFLKYLHRIRTFKQAIRNIPNISFYLIEKKKNNSQYASFIGEMPKHIKKHITEYNYLFEEICNVIRMDNSTSRDDYTTLYNIGNNMRKFLESFLAFKYAGYDKPLLFLPHFLDGSESSELNRAPNELSHLVIWLEKGTNILDFAEAERLCKIILKMIKNSDDKHFRALCYKIGEREKWEEYYNLV